MNAKTFLLALSFFPHDLASFKKFLKDKRLTQAEKNILRGWLELRDGAYESLISKLESIITDDPFVESQIHFLLGTAYTNCGKSHEAIAPLRQALKLLEGLKLKESIFACHFHLFMTFCNLKDTKQMAKALDQMTGMKLRGFKEKLNLYRAQFNYFAYIGQEQKAKLYLKKIDSLKERMNDGQRIFFLIDKFDFNIKCDDFQACERDLNEMKKHRKFQLSSNYKFMRKLLDFYLHDTPLYLYPYEFQEQSILYHQVKFLIFYETGDIENAKSEWKELSAISSEAYQRGFIYAGDKCLFQVAFDKIKQKQNAFPAIEVPKAKGIDQKCLDILKDGRPIPQEELFLLLWGKEHESKKELTRLRMLISRLRSKYSLKITSKKGAYQLEPSEDSSQKAG